MAFQTTNMVADWSELPFDLLCRIATNHLTRVEDFVVGSCVCHSWHNAFARVKKNWDPSGRQMPWLMLAEPKIDTTTNDRNKGRRSLFNPSEGKCYNLMLPETLGRRCWGSDHGWVVTLGLDLEMHLFNPLTKVRQSLPSQRTLLHQTEGTESNYEWIRNNYVHQVRVLKMSLYGSDRYPNTVKHQFVVMAVHGEVDWLSYAKPGDPSWMPIDTTTEKGMFVLDIAYCNGMVLLLCKGTYVVLNVVDSGLFNDSSRPLRAVDFLPHLRMFPEPYDMSSMFNMFESFGDLLLVVRYKAEEDLGELENDLDYYFRNQFSEDRLHWHYRTEKFQVFKLDFHDKQWKEVKDLGDRALFVGENGCISVQASNDTSCRHNSIYFSDDEREHWGLPNGSPGHDMGVYSMEDGFIHPLYRGDDIYSRFSCPFWFTPKFN